MFDIQDDHTDFLEVPITEERPWMVFGACRDTDPAVFFPTTRDGVDEALAVCATCPVRSDCLDYAIEARERFGVWGGMTEKQRRRLQRKSA
jgi:WhiB family redox-sensing transcriptional regulator